VAIIRFDVHKLMEFIGNAENVNTYLYNERTKGVADCAMTGGFNFDTRLSNTADMVDPADAVVMKWWNQRKRIHGHYTVVVQIAKPLLEKYSAGPLLPEEMLSRGRFFNEESHETTYILQPEYVKGHFNRETNECYLNPGFNPSYDNHELAALNAVRFLGPI
jgi:hypothetical protein